MEGFGDAVHLGGVRESGQPIDLLLAGFQALGQLRRAHILANHLIEQSTLEREAHRQCDEVFSLPFRRWEWERPGARRDNAPAPVPMPQPRT